jgi:hypothetical protein
MVVIIMTREEEIEYISNIFKSIWLRNQYKSFGQMFADISNFSSAIYYSDSDFKSNLDLYMEKEISHRKAKH